MRPPRLMRPTVRFTTGSTSGTDATPSALKRARHGGHGGNADARLNHAQHGRHMASFTHAGAFRHDVFQALIEQIAIAGGLSSDT